MKDRRADHPVLVMVTTGGRNDAERLGEGLVETHLAARCSVIPMVHSFYHDEEGRLRREHESLLLIKTVESRAHAVQEYVRANHSDQAPEILQITIEGGLPAYLRWLADQVAEPTTDVQVNT